METVEKYRNFLVDLSEKHPNKIFFESVITAYNILFEADSGIKTAETDEADQLSSITKGITNISKDEQNAIYNKFIEIDPQKIYPHQTISMIFGKLKNMIMHLMAGRIKLDEIMEYLAKYA